MRKLIFAINITLDGCCDHTKGIPDDETMAYFTNITSESDTFIYGRKTYELMIPYWPDMAKNNSGHTAADNEFAKAFDSVDNIVVFSKTLEQAEGKNTRIVRTGLKEEILKLKQAPGKNLLTGGVNIPAQLLELGLIDEFHFVIHPIIAGEGVRLFDSAVLPEFLQLKLIGSTFFKSGCVAHRYSK